MALDSDKIHGQAQIQQGIWNKNENKLRLTFIVVVQSEF